MKSNLVYMSAFSSRKRKDPGPTFEKRGSLRKKVPHFLGAYAASSSGALVPVTLLDLSKDGFLIEVSSAKQKFNVGEAFALRIYVSDENYLHVSAKIVNARDSGSRKVKHYGARLSEAGQSQLSMYHFTRFLEVLAHILKPGDALERVA